MDGDKVAVVYLYFKQIPPLLFFCKEHNRSQKARDTCPYCPDDDHQSTTGPRAAVISNSTHCYLALPLTVPLVPGHCLIVPVQHVVNVLECEEAAWDEIRVQMEFHENLLNVNFNIPCIFRII